MGEDAWLEMAYEDANGGEVDTAAEYDPDEEPHVGHFSRLGGTWWCDTCDSPYCELA